MYNPYFFFGTRQSQIERRLPVQPSLPTPSYSPREEFILQNVMATLNSQQQIFKEIEALKQEVKQVKEKNIEYLEKIKKLENEKK